ncbi:MAG: O-antigen ligase family protein [Patescibacteria group bacterium]|nr:O-antigen ligase family protein [Patescibacteria group bacterium]
MKIKTKNSITFLKYFFFFLFALSIPFQKRHIFFYYPIAGEFNEWTAISIYVSDILLFLSLIFWLGELVISRNHLRLRNIITPLYLPLSGEKHTPLIRGVRGVLNYFREGILNLKKKNKLLIIGYWLLVTLLAIAFFSLINAQNLNIALFRLLKLGEVILLFIFIVSNFGSRKLRLLLYLFLLTSGIAQGIIAVGQYFHQHSLGLKILGENDLAPNIIGVAKIVVNGGKIIRAYGAFPHPNILGGFLIATILFCFYLWTKIPRVKWGKFLKIILLFILSLFTITITLTFSRTAWLGLIIALLGLLIINLHKIKNYAPPLGIIIITALTLFYFLQPQILTRQTISDSSGDFALSNRAFLNQIALLAIAKHPFLGVGIGNFVLSISDFTKADLPAWRYQPSHNLYLAMASETGLPSLLIFLTFLYLTITHALGQIRNDPEIGIIFWIFIAYLFISCLDHYFYDLQQGMLLFWLILGIIWAISLQKLNNIA